MPVDMAALAADLAAESAVTRALVAGLDEADWRTPTPAPSCSTLSPASTPPFGCRGSGRP